MEVQTGRPTEVQLDGLKIISQAVIRLLAPQTLVSFFYSALKNAAGGYNAVLDIPQSITRALTDGVAQELWWSDHVRSEVRGQSEGGSRAVTPVKPAPHLQA